MNIEINPPSKLNFLNGKAWLSIPYFEGHLFKELGIEYDSQLKEYKKLPRGVSVYGDIIYCVRHPKNIFWNRLCLEKPFTASFNSINEAAQILRSIQRNWALYPFNCIRRSELIKQKLPYISEKTKSFPYKVPQAQMGIWTLLDENTLFASALTSSPFPLGQIFFEEDKINPPSRAYLKIQEALTLMQYYKDCAVSKTASGQTDGAQFLPDTKQNTVRDFFINGNTVCTDAGASPGGWTWVLDGLGAKIIAVDRAELDAKLMKKPNIEFIKHDAFTLAPETFGKVDLVCSDVICYPPRLLNWIEKWLNSGLCENFICTIKMQGEPDMETVRKFAAVPNSKIIHLTANKHELTWLHAPFL